jgi:hypothetical protein
MKPTTAKVVLSGFEQIAKGIPQSEWLSTPSIVQYVRANFEMKYVPERLIAALGLRFSDPELNDTVAEKQSKLASSEVQHATKP